MKGKGETISAGAFSAQVWPRGDGRWSVSWWEGRGRSTTRKTKAEAKQAALKIVRERAGNPGGRRVSEAQESLLRRFLEVCGSREPLAVLAELEDALKRLHGASLPRVVNHWLASGVGEVARVTLAAAVDRYLDAREDRARMTRAGLRKELRAFTARHVLDLQELSAEVLRAWIGRANRDGSPPGARFFNNRLATWAAFLRACRDELRLWPRGLPLPVEGIKPRKLAAVPVPIWRPSVAHGLVVRLWRENRRVVPYVVIGCWLGLRPSEITRLRWSAFDWERNYVELSAEVCRKLSESRFVPLNAKARHLLQRYLKSAGLWAKALAGELQTKCTFTHDDNAASKAAREAGLIESWPQDVMRHSYISYLIAAGHSKHEVAEWAGNSERIIIRNYKRPLRREDGVEWLALLPECELPM